MMGPTIYLPRTTPLRAQGWSLDSLGPEIEKLIAAIEVGQDTTRPESHRDKLESLVGELRGATLHAVEQRYQAAELEWLAHKARAPRPRGSPTSRHDAHATVLPAFVLRRSAESGDVSASICACKSLAAGDVEAVGEKIAEVSVEDTVATHRLLTLLREFDAGNGWGMQRAFTCAHWLSWRVGLSLGAAREYVRVAKALGELPEIDAAFRNDEDRRSVRCYPDGNGMMRIVAVVRVEEADIIMRALDAGREAVGAGEKVDVSAETSAGAHSDERAGKTAMEAEVDISAETSSGVRSSEAEEKAFADEVDELADILGDVADDPEVRDAEEAAQRREREAARRIEEEEDEATLHTTGAFDRRARAEEVRRWGSQAEALVLLAESFLAGRRGQRNGGARTVMTVHVDSAVLSGSRKDGLSELEDGTRLAPETVRRLACDASVVRIGYRIEVGEGGAITFCAPSGMKLESAPSLPELTPEVLAALEEEHCVAKHELCGDHLRPINYTPMNLDYAVSSLLAAHAVRHAAAHQAV